MRANLLTLGALAAMLAPAAMAPPSEPFTATGTILAGNATSFAIGSVTENYWALTGGMELQGLDGAAVALPAGAAGKVAHVSGDDGGAGFYDLDVWYYDADRLYMNVACATANVDEDCTVPRGAAYLFIELFSGAAVTYTVTI